MLCNCVHALLPTVPSIHAYLLLATSNMCCAEGFHMKEMLQLLSLAVGT